VLEKKRKDYAFQRQFHEKPRITPGCRGNKVLLTFQAGKLKWGQPPASQPERVHLGMTVALLHIQPNQTATGNSNACTSIKTG